MGLFRYFQRRPRCVSHAFALRVKCRPDIGNMDCPGGALQQAQSEPLLKAGNAAADARFLCGKGARCGGKTAVFYNSSEYCQVIEVFH